MSAHAVTAILDANLDAWLVWQLADSAFLPAASPIPVDSKLSRKMARSSPLPTLKIFCAPRCNKPRTVRCRSWARASMRWSRSRRLTWLFDAFTPNHVANRASRAQGQAWLASAERSFGSPAIAELRETVLRDALPGHFAPVFGAAARALGVECATALRLFVFLQLRGWTSSAVRLGLIGPLQAQAIQHRLSAHAESVAELGRELSLDDAAQTAPLLDLFHATHDRLYSRLFQS